MSAKRLGTLFLALAAIAALLPASASAITFGANLNRVPNSGDTCLDIQLIVTAPTCTVESNNLSTGESPFPPVGEGTISAVRVRVGPQTGPMQVVVEEALRQDNPFEPGKPNYACCKLIAASPIFTPAANAVTTIPVNFRVRNDLTPDSNGIYVDQHLALSVLDPNVPIPAALDGNSFVGAWWPAWGSIGEERVGPAGSFLPAVVLFNAEWTPIAAPPPAVTPTAQPAPAPLVVPRVAAVRKGVALVRILCSFDQACIGRLLLQSRQTAGAAAVSALARTSAKKKRGGRKKGGKRRTITYASVKIRIPAGKRKTIRAPLRRLGKRLLRRRAKARVWANVKIKGASVSPTRLTLKRAPAKGKKAKRRKAKRAGR